MTAARFAALAQRAGITLIGHGSWQTHNRGDRGTGWGPVNGVMIHHTATSGLDGTLHVIRVTGQGPEVPAPLYSGLVDKGGALHMVGWGRCNHAGLGDDDVLRAVIREDDPLPRPNERNTDGNSRFYGFAALNRGDGRDPYPPAQLQTLAAVSALICRYHRWTARSVIGHRDWTSAKPDPWGPGGSQIPEVRRRTAALLR